MRSRGHKVFLDRDDLPPGRSYDDQIEHAIKQSDILIFLIAPASVERGRYTLTEMEFARSAWSHPADRVLPVLVEPTDLTKVPPFLKGVTILEPQGNVAAEVSSAAERLRGTSQALTRAWRTALISFAVFLGVASMTHPLFNRVSPGGLDWLFFSEVLSGGAGLAAAIALFLFLHGRRQVAPAVMAALVVFGTLPATYFMIDRLPPIGRVDFNAFDEPATQSEGDPDAPASSPRTPLTEAQRASLEQMRSANSVIEFIRGIYTLAAVASLVMLGIVAGMSIAAPEIRSARRWCISIGLGIAAIVPAYLCWLTSDRAFGRELIPARDPFCAVGGHRISGNELLDCERSGRLRLRDGKVGGGSLTRVVLRSLTFSARPQADQDVPHSSHDRADRRCPYHRGERC